MLTKEELISIGVNPDNLVYPNGEMNIIVQQFGYENGTRTVYNPDTDKEDEVPLDHMCPDIYQPRRNGVWNAMENEIPFETDEEKADYAKWLRDSAERHKIMAYYLMKQADEIEKFGYPKTDCYYPE